MIKEFIIIEESTKTEYGITLFEEGETLYISYFERDEKGNVLLNPSGVSMKKQSIDKLIKGLETLRSGVKE